MSNLYFNHSYSLRNEESMLELRAEFGPTAYAIYLFCLETMAESDHHSINKNRLAGLSLSFGVEKDLLEKIINRCVELDMFIQNGDIITSPQLEFHLQKRDKIREKRQQSGSKGGQSGTKQTSSKTQANAKQVLSKPEPNAKQEPSKTEAKSSKEKKGKEKEKETPLAGGKEKEFPPPAFLEKILEKFPDLKAQPGLKTSYEAILEKPPDQQSPYIDWVLANKTKDPSKLVKPIAWREWFWEDYCARNLQNSDQTEDFEGNRIYRDQHTGKRAVELNPWDYHSEDEFEQAKKRAKDRGLGVSASDPPYNLIQQWQSNQLQTT